MIEDVIGLSDRARDLTLEAIPIGRRRRGKAVEIALTSRNTLCFLKDGRIVHAARRKRRRANEPSEHYPDVAGVRRVERKGERQAED